MILLVKFLCPTKTSILWTALVKGDYNELIGYNRILFKKMFGIFNEKLPNLPLYEMKVSRARPIPEQTSSVGARTVKC